MADHDLMDLEEACGILKMSPPKFQLLLASGRIPAFRSNGKIGVRREDVIEVMKERTQRQEAKAQAKSVKAGKSAAGDSKDGKDSSPEKSDKDGTHAGNGKPRFSGFRSRISSAGAPAVTPVPESSELPAVSVEREEKDEVEETLPEPGPRPRVAAAASEVALETKTAPRAEIERARKEPELEFELPKSETKPASAAPPARSVRRRKRKGGISYLAVGAVLVTMGVAYFTVKKAQQGHGVASEPTTPSRDGAQRGLVERPYEHCRTAPGKVESVSGNRPLAFQLTGRIKVVSVDEGQEVKKDQIVAELDNDEYQAYVASAKAELGAAEAQAKSLEANIEAERIGAVFDVERLQAEYAQMSTGARKESVLAAQAAVQQAKALYDNAETEAKRYSDPDGIRKGVFTESQQANALNNAKAAKAALDVAQQRLSELENGYRDEDKKKALAMLEKAKADVVRIETTKQSRLDEAKAAVDNARAQLKLAEVNLEKTVLRSPIDGVVVRKFRYAGQTVGMLPPEIVVTVADMERLQVVASVDEGDYPDIFPGQEVRVTAVAFPGKNFEGTVEKVGKEAGEKPFETGEARERVDIKIVETVVRFNGPVPLKLGQRVTAWFKLKDEPEK
ncbi:MAG: efflux RND transporter periplasmic adaptor subunit [Planctomycetes bacterium]|nr:efflux RND transporter periplasmic adaptor subunit [Planctomycetota bacterium]